MRWEAIKKQTVMIILADQDILYVTLWMFHTHF